MQKIMFTKGLTRAVLEDLKTKTRRLIKVPDTWHGIHVCGVGPDTDKQSLVLYDADGASIEDPKTRLCGQIMPQYKVGEIVAVAQPYCEIMPYLADSFYKPAADFMEEKPGYRNKMFVKADLMPHRIRIANVRVERLQDISDEDCLKEGIERVYYGNEEWFKAYDTKDGCKCAPTPKEAFAALIKKMHGRKVWDDNPWTFAYDFTLIQ